MNDLEVKFAVWGIDLKNILNSGGRPVFSHPSYTVGVSLARLQETWTDVGTITRDKPGSIFTGKAYTNRFKRDAIWDFGDGSRPVSGQTAGHTYEKPGKYTVSCTLFTSDKKSVKNSYTVELLVKEPLPTRLSAPGEDLSVAKTVKSGRVGKLGRFQATVSTVYGDPPAVSVDRVFPEGVEPERHLSAVQNPLVEKYWCLFTPRENGPLALDLPGRVTPSFDRIYGRFYCKTATDSLGDATVHVAFEGGIVDPAAQVEPERLSLQIPDPDGNGVDTREIALEHHMDESSLPSTWSPIGHRAFFTLLYKADTVGLPSTVFLKFPDSFVNMAPLGVAVETAGNSREDVRLAWTLNGFIHSLEGDADRPLLHSLWRGVAQGAAITAYVPYGEENWGLKAYIPKDLGETTLAVTAENAAIASREGGADWFFPVKITPRGDFSAAAQLWEGADMVASCVMEAAAPDRDSLTVPHRRYDHVDEETLVKAHTPHEAFNQAPAAREALVSVLRNGGWLNKTLTKVLRIFEDRADVDYCHVENLVSILKSMGEEPGEYDATGLSALNETMELCRILSMEHTDLVGHMVGEGLDISFDGETGGANLGDEVNVDDLLFTTPEGYVAALAKGGKTYTLVNPLPLVAWDSFTRDSRIVNFHNVLSPVYYEGARMEFSADWNTENTMAVRVGDYTTSWGWGLLLPERFYKVAGEDNAISAYYRFFLLNPEVARYRHGAFLDGESVPEGFYDSASWDSDWGVSHRLLLKALQEKSPGESE